MSSSQKVYVIDSVTSKSDPRGKSSVVYAPGESPGRARGGRAGASGPSARADAEMNRLDEKGSPALAFLSYLAGPLSILVTRRGRRSAPWVSLACVSCGAAAVLALRASGVIPASTAFGAGSFLWLAGACVAAVIGFTAWARGAYLIGRRKSALLRRLPAALRHPGAVGVLGFAVPGFGLHVAGRPMRAGCAIWSASLLVVSSLVLVNAPGLWRHSMNGGTLSPSPDDLEIGFIFFAAMGLFGAVAWIVQALDGMRIAAARPDGQLQPRGDLAAVALVVAIAAFVGLFQPADVARDLDRFAVAMHWEGMRLIPLCATACAMRLDPSRPEYVIHAIAMNESLDRLGDADALRDALAERWDAYAQTLRMVP